MAEKDDELLSGKQAAEFLGIHQNTMVKWRKRNVGPKPIKYGRLFRYKRSELERFMREGN